jgi:hypothetical protein
LRGENKMNAKQIGKKIALGITNSNVVYEGQTIKKGTKVMVGKGTLAWLLSTVGSLDRCTVEAKGGTFLYIDNSDAKDVLDKIDLVKIV